MTSPSRENGSVQESGGFAGTLRNIQITDIIQMCCLAGASLCIRVSQDSDQGTIHIQDGEVVHTPSLDPKQASRPFLPYWGGKADNLKPWKRRPLSRPP